MTKYNGSKLFAARAHATIVHLQNGNPVAHEDLVKETLGARPISAHHLAMRSAIRIHEQRNFRGRILRQVKQAAKHGAIFRAEIDELRRRELIRSDSPRLPKDLAASADAAQRYLRRSHERGESINVVLCVVGKVDVVCSRLVFTDDLQVTAIDLDRTQMALAVVSGLCHQVTDVC